MVGGYTDLRLGRRGHFIKCKCWNRDDEYKDISEYILQEQPLIFYAERVNAQTLQKMPVNNSFLFDENAVTLKTNANIIIDVGDLVEYEEKHYVVSSVQILEVVKNQQFMKRASKETYIQLKG